MLNVGPKDAVAAQIVASHKARIVKCEQSIALYDSIISDTRSKVSA